MQELQSGRPWDSRTRKGGPGKGQVPAPPCPSCCALTLWPPTPWACPGFPSSL